MQWHRRPWDLERGLSNRVMKQSQPLSRNKINRKWISSLSKMATTLVIRRRSILPTRTNRRLPRRNRKLQTTRDRSNKTRKAIWLHHRKTRKVRSPELMTMAPKCTTTWTEVTTINGSSASREPSTDISYSTTRISSRRHSMSLISRAESAKWARLLWIKKLARFWITFWAQSR